MTFSGLSLASYQHTLSDIQQQVVLASWADAENGIETR